MRPARIAKFLAALWRSEPAAITALAVALCGALAVPDAWAKFFVAVLAVAGGLVTRSQVYSPATVNKLTGPGPDG
jgi:hypothetical protein